MSTNINISVGDNKLLAQASLQQNASRQAQLEKEANKRLQSEAEINRVNALAAQGKDANGNPVTGTPFQVPQLERRPAANRQPSIGFGECFYRIENFINSNAQIRITVWSGDGITQASAIVENSGYPVGYRTIDEVYGSLPPEGQTATTQTVWFTVYGGSTYEDPGAALTNESVGVSRDPGIILRIITLPTGKDSAIICFLGQVCCFKSLGYLVYNRVNFTSTTEYPISEGVDFLLTQSFFVTKTTVKTVATPSELVNALRSSKTFENVKNDPQTQFIEDDIYVSSALVPQTVSGTFLVFTGVNREYFGSFNNNYSYIKQDYIDYWAYQNEEEALGGVGETADFLQGWGIEPSAFANAFQVNQIALSSPGIYDVISQLLPYNDDTATLDSIKQHVNPVGETVKWIRSRDYQVISPKPTKIDVDTWPAQLPETYYLPDEFGSYVISSFDYLTWRDYKEYERIQPDNTSRRFWSDWGNPSYCRAKALALGFTPADLTP